MFEYFPTKPLGVAQTPGPMQFKCTGDLLTSQQ